MAYLHVDGILFPKYVQSTENLKFLRDEFVVRDGDVIILTYPKSGSHWMQEILSLIYTKGDPSWVQSVAIWDRSPWLETKEGYENIKIQNDLRMFSSHLPIQFFPKSFFSSKAKAIYLMRNPRDILISSFYFNKALTFTKDPESFDQHFEWFIQGNVVFGSWFDHIQGWLSMKGKENFLIISYEELQQDTRANVERICQFLDKKLSPEELNSVLKNIAFEVMKENRMSNLSLVPNDFLDHSKGKLMRKGVSGDWKNHFTVAQSEVFDQIYKEKMETLPQGLFPWE